MSGTTISTQSGYILNSGSVTILDRLGKLKYLRFLECADNQFTEEQINKLTTQLNKDVPPDAPANMVFSVKRISSRETSSHEGFATKLKPPELAVKGIVTLPCTNDPVLINIKSLVVEAPSPTYTQ